MSPMLDEVVTSLDNSRGLRVWARVSIIIIGALTTALTGLGAYVAHSFNDNFTDVKDGIKTVQVQVSALSSNVATLNERTTTNERRISAIEGGYLYRGR